MKKIVNLIDPKTGRAVLDPKTHQPLAREVEMTAAEIESFEAERVVEASRPRLKKESTEDMIRRIVREETAGKGRGAKA